MIYSCYWTAIQTKIYYTSANITLTKMQARMHGKNVQTEAANFIKAAKGDKFVWIVTISQDDAFKAWIKANKLESNIEFQMEQPITNGNYLTQGRKLWLYVLKADQ